MSNTNSEVEKLAQNTASVVNQVLNEVVKPVVEQVIPSVNNAIKEVSVDNVKVEQINEKVLQEVVERKEEVLSNKELTVPLVDEMFTAALNQLKTRIGLTEINAQSFILVVKYAMEIVEMIDMKGTEQREFAIRLIRRVIYDSNLNDDDEALCLDMLNSGAVGQTIDLVVDATNGQLNVNSAVRLAENCCFTFLSSRKNRRSKKQNRK